MPDLNLNNLAIKENVIDRIVRYLDPVKAERRFRARAMLALSGSYIGASRAKRSLSQWRTSWGDADSDIHPYARCALCLLRVGNQIHHTDRNCGIFYNQISSQGEFGIKWTGADLLTISRYTTKQATYRTTTSTS